MGAFLYGFPSRKIKVIGVTGTSGKTTVIEMISKILEEAGHKTAVLSSTKFKIGKREEENKLKMTMPGRTKIQNFLNKAAKADCQYAILEVTSEGIKQYRHKFIDFKAAVFTNLSPEHIERHKGFENYKKAKGKLFETTKRVHIINLDDRNADYFLNFPADETYCYGIDNELKIEKLKIGWKLKIENWKFIKADAKKISDKGIEFKIRNTKFHLSLLGDFNIYNALAAICVGLSQGIELEICKRALNKIKGVPGRMEVVVKGPFTVVVDYAHTPEALKKVYQTIRNFISQYGGPNSNLRVPISEMVCVLGACGGGRDKWKRPVMGEIAAKYCDKIIITNEDPYDEDPFQILSMVRSGISKSQFPNSNLYEILDRRKAIRKSLQLAGAKNVVIITGKGSEPWMCVKNGKKIPWDDRQIVKEEMKKIKPVG